MPFLINLQGSAVFGPGLIRLRIDQNPDHQVIHRVGADGDADASVEHEEGEDDAGGEAEEEAEGFAGAVGVAGLQEVPDVGCGEEVGGSDVVGDRKEGT